MKLKPLTFLSFSAAPIVATLFLGGLASPALAQTSLQCTAPSTVGEFLHNQATYSYSSLRHQLLNIYDTDNSVLTGITEPVSGQMTNNGNFVMALQGIRDQNGSLVFGWGNVATVVEAELRQQGVREAEAKRASVAAVSAFVALPENATLQQVIEKAQQAIAQTRPDASVDLNQGSFRRRLALALTGLNQFSLESIGFQSAEATSAHDAALAAVMSASPNARFDELTQKAFQDAIAAVPAQTTLLGQAKQALERDRLQLQPGATPAHAAGDLLSFEFTLNNSGRAPVQVEVPTAEAIQQTGITGPATIATVEVEGYDRIPATLTILPNVPIKLWVTVRLNAVPDTATTIGLTLGNGCSGDTSQQTLTLIPPQRALLIDPLGRITGCAGEILPDYRGFSIGLYLPDPANATGDVRGLVPLTTTEVPDQPNNRIPAGLEPNDTNSNPFFLTNDDQGQYNFLLDVERGQLERGQSYILMVNPPADSSYSQRRIRLTMGDRTGNTIAYMATALDGRPISATNNQTTVSGTITVEDANNIGLVLALLNLDTGVCDSQSLQIVKTGDRAAAAPGDTVIYRLSIRNLASAAIQNVAVTDLLPLGFNFLASTARGELGGRAVTVNTEQNGSTVIFQVEEPLAQGEVLNIAYAAQLTPDALRGTGQNSAIATAQRADNRWVVRDGPSVHRLRLQAGIISDCGTIIGRVFVDRNFDGEQQPGEPGVPNAVIFMEDGTRITTDADGLFSLANVLPGYHTGALDLTSLPGYTIAPNLQFIERNSPSRLVHLEPGGLVRMNFAVTPTFQEGQSE